MRNLLETKALYSRLQRHNADLQAELDEQLARERREAAEFAHRAQRVEDALACDSISMVFQPIVSLVDGRLVGVEALARFHPEPRRHRTSGSPRRPPSAAAWSWSSRPWSAA